jgi:pimeloyl-ACP methyl ester carboxylesterase
VLLLAGERDEYCPTEELRAMATELRRARVEILPRTDHYLWRREREAATLIGEHLDDVLSGTAV